MLISIFLFHILSRNKMASRKASCLSHNISHSIVNSILYQEIIDKLSDHMLPKDLIAKKALMDLFQVQTSIENTLIVDLCDLPQKIDENYDNRPDPVAFRVRKQVKAHQQKKNKSKTCFHQANPFFNHSKIFNSSKKVQITKATANFPIKLREERPIPTKKDQREVQFLTYNDNMNNLFNFFSGKTDQTIEHVLRQKKFRNELSSKQKTMEARFQQKCESKTKKQVQIKKTIVALKRQNKRKESNYSKNSSIRSSPKYIKMDFSIIDFDEIPRNDKKLPSEVQKQGKTLKNRQFQNLNFVQNGKCFSSQLIRKLSVQQTPISKQNQRNCQGQEKTRRPILRQTIKNIPKQVSFEILQKLKSSESLIKKKQVKPQRNPLTKKTKIIQFQPSISRITPSPSVVSTLTQQQMGQTTNYRSGETREKRRNSRKTEKITVGNKPALNFLLNNERTTRKKVAFDFFLDKSDV